MNGTILDQEKVDAILSEKNIYDPLVIAMKWESLLKELDVFEKVSVLKSEISNYLGGEVIKFENGKFISKGYFSSMSSILEKIYGSIRNLEEIQIFATNSFTFDVDYAIDKHKYATNAPNLIVVAPKVFVKKHVIVDLTCQQIPSKIVPSKAPDGKNSSPNGQDGKAGLPGYNGGSFVVYADYLKDGSYLNVISGEGEGGAGQDGKCNYFV